MADGHASQLWGEIWQHGVFREIDRPERLVFTTAWEKPAGTPEHEMLVTIAFAEEIR